MCKLYWFAIISLARQCMSNVLYIKKPRNLEMYLTSTSSQVMIFFFFCKDETSLHKMFAHTPKIF